MDKKQYKTSEAQRKAVKDYRERNGNPYTTISITLTREEAAAHRQTLAEHKRKPVDVWRNAIEALKAEDNAAPDEQSHGATTTPNE